MNAARSNRARRLYWTTSTFSGIGLTLAGPALPELGARTGAGVGEIGVLFAASSIGALVGSLTAGQLIDRFDGHRVFALSTLTMAAGLAAIPILASLNALIVAFAIMGIGGAAFATSGNTLLMWWRHDVVRNLNILHLCFGVGAIIAPLAAFVSLNGAYWLTAAVIGTIGLSVRSLPAPRPNLVGGEGQKAPTMTVVLLAATFFSVYVAFELGYSNWIATYGTERGLSTGATSLVNSGFWVTFATGRAIAAFAPSLPRPKIVVAVSLAISLVAALLLVAGRNGTGPAFVAGTLLAGLGAAAQFPTTLSYLNRRVNASGAFTAAMVASAGVGGFIGPWSFGRAIATWGLTALSLATLSLVVAMIVLFAILDRCLDRVV